MAVGALVLLDEVLHEVHGQHAARCDRQGPREAPNAGAQLQDALLLDASEHGQHLCSSDRVCEQLVIDEPRGSQLRQQPDFQLQD